MAQFVRGQVVTSLWDVGDDVEAGNSKRIAAGDPKGQKRKRTVKNRLALSHEQTENRTRRIREGNSEERRKRL